jgi:hypothetical protein
MPLRSLLRSACAYRTMAPVEQLRPAFAEFIMLIRFPFPHFQRSGRVISQRHASVTVLSWSRTSKADPLASADTCGASPNRHIDSPPLHSPTQLEMGIRAPPIGVPGFRDNDRRRVAASAEWLARHTPIQAGAAPTN